MVQERKSAQLTQAEQAKRSELLLAIASVVEEVTGVHPDEVTPNSNFVDDLDIDSLSMVEVAVQTEDRYNIRVPDQDLAGLRTVGDLITYIIEIEQVYPEAAAELRKRFEEQPYGYT